MMVIKGNGGEGKSQIGAVLNQMLGCNMKDGSIGKISENRFARADLEHILLCVDDDMRMEALRQTNYVKSIVTAQGKMDLERKGKQSYQGWMFARLMAFSNGDLQALYDRSDGFYRRQLVLTTKEKPTDRADDPDLAEKMKAEVEGIFLWAFEGLRRLISNNFKFTESDRIRENREAVKRDNNNIFDFMESEGYIRRKADASISSKDFYAVYRMWCEENSLVPLKSRSFSDAMVANARKYNLEHCNNVTNSAGRRVWGFMGVEAVARPDINGFHDNLTCTYVPGEWRDRC
jgi:putative DNA primase/helicase